ncbi:MAG TPA: hypothetical protein VFY82_15165, partial [Acidimicrobiales bacterium]|nr:hypothetical protein [Acidimicrobiales bacterium]
RRRRGAVVMDEHDLWSLGREPLGPHGQARPVEDVLRRGRGLRRRAVAARATAAVALVTLVAGVGVLATRPADDADVSVSGTDRELPVKWTTCDPPPAEPIAAEELDGLRLLPTTLPDGIELVAARPERQATGTCVDVDPALVLRADGGDGTVAAEIVLEGPFGEPYRGGDEVALEPTELRGRAASRTYNPTAPESPGGFTWTEPDGASWLLDGVGTTESELRGVAEALVLHGSPPQGEPAAALPDEAVPDRYHVSWQAPGLPRVEGPSQRRWIVTMSPPGPTGCEITLATTARRAPPGRLWSVTPGSRSHAGLAVRGTASGFAVEERGQVYLDWQEAPGVVGSLRCTGDVSTAVEVADSLVEVEPDDPRIDTGAPG